MLVTGQWQQREQPRMQHATSTRLINLHLTCTSPNPLGRESEPDEGASEGHAGSRGGLRRAGRPETRAVGQALAEGGHDLPAPPSGEASAGAGSDDFGEGASARFVVVLFCLFFLPLGFNAYFCVWLVVGGTYDRRLSGIEQGISNVVLRNQE